MNQIKAAQYIIDEFTNSDKKVIRVFFADPFECCIVLKDYTCKIVTGDMAQWIKNDK